MFGFRKCKHCNEFQMVNDLAIRFRELERENKALKKELEEKTRPVCETEREESLYEPVAKPDFGAMPNSAAQTKQSVTSNVPIENPKTTRC